MGEKHHFIKGAVSSALLACLVACSGSPVRPAQVSSPLRPRLPPKVPKAVAPSKAMAPPRLLQPAKVLPTPIPLVSVASRLKQELAGARTDISFVVLDEPIQAREEIRRFYQGRDHIPAWVNDEGPLPRAKALLEAIRESEEHGLEPDYFHSSALETGLADLERRRRLQMPHSSSRLVEIELLLTDSFLNLFSQYQNGAVHPSQSDEEWFIPRKDRKEPIQALVDAVASERVADTLKDALPQHEEYQRLKEGLATYRKMARAGGWKPIPPGRVLRMGDLDRRVPMLRRRLLLSGDLEALSNPQERNSQYFDRKLSAALIKYQKRNGLKADGVLSTATYTKLNIPVSKRIRQIMVNMERWRWLPRDFGDRYVAVNIASYELSAVENGKVALRMPVIVGSQYKQTPVFSGRMSQVVLNPSWVVPHSMAVDSLLPKIKKDPGFLAEHHYSVVKEGEGKQWIPVDPAEIRWDEIDVENFNLTLRHDPGPGNPLGQVKFVFPNRFSIFLHDTPSKVLFSKTQRTISSGCIRLAKPLELLRFVLRNRNAAGSASLDGERLKEELAKGVETEVPLRRAIPVLMLYQTAWVDEHGDVQFRDDVYEKDEVVQQFLLARRPRGSSLIALPEKMPTPVRVTGNDR